MGRLLKDIDFPSDKQRIIQHVQQRTGSNADTKDILTILKNIEDKQYRNVAEVTTAAVVEASFSFFTVQSYRIRSIFN